jgi:hypothetical protein
LIKSQKREAGTIKPGSDKPEVIVAACHFLLVGVASTILAATGITVFTTINFTEITVTATQLTRVLARLIRGGISHVATSYDKARRGHHKSSNSIFVLL